MHALLRGLALVRNLFARITTLAASLHNKTQNAVVATYSKAQESAYAKVREAEVKAKEEIILLIQRSVELEQKLPEAMEKAKAKAEATVNKLNRALR